MARARIAELTVIPVVAFTLYLSVLVDVSYSLSSNEQPRWRRDWVFIEVIAFMVQLMSYEIVTAIQHTIKFVMVDCILKTRWSALGLCVELIKLA